MEATTPEPQPWRLVFALGLTQIIAWGSFYYAFAVLIEPLGLAVRAPKAVVVGAFSAALLVTGLASAPVGALVDRFGGRGVMTAGSLAGAALLAVLPWVDSVPQLYLVWMALGAVMAATLYDPAFAVLAQVFREGQRKAITVLTLFGGFASTVFWPLTQALVDRWDWQVALWVLAAVNLLVCVPVHLALLPAAPAAAPRHERPVHPLRGALRDPRFYGLAAAFTGNALVFSAMSVHLLGLLQGKGLSATHAAWIGAMVGPMQVLGRVLEYTWLRHQTAARVGVLACWLLPAALVLLLAPGSAFAVLAVFALLYGASNGVMTIVRGAIPRELYGGQAYGAINGALATPVQLAKAVGPIAAALVLAGAGSNGLLLALAALGVLAAAVFTWTVRSASAVPAGEGGDAAKRAPSPGRKA
ncbi:MFS transporter [Ramlibacter sp. Leaf400]|uniref:MFS transporter n=1 Tax=Ramlibacter sp. Leaf400 TaxID=1736365 RepID=UPI0006FC6FCD|nr:MFS transporter [Ramlibacter sp. Leaf400]KQT13488.1 hypothetical protein ASG30_18850 [Ramlibacter sp. Leaf400]